MDLPFNDNNFNEIIALVDGHAFYCGCERVFDPKLNGMPVVVLSSGDGAVVARTDEAKALGIKMSQPAFELKELVRSHGLIMKSSNFELYFDMHRRMMMAISDCVASIEPYSVDECFALLTGMEKNWDIKALGHHIQASVFRKTGLQVGVGISRTKTSAKLCNWASKKWKKKTGSVVCLLDPEPMTKLLDYADVKEVWGVGSRLNARMQDMGIKTAGDLARANAAMIRKTFGVTTERTLQELRWNNCFGFNETPTPQQTFTMTRSFSQKITNLNDLEVAISTYAAKIAFKLRREKALATCLKVFIATSRFGLIDKYVSRSGVATFILPTNDTRELLKAATSVLRSIYVEGHAWAKAGVLVVDTVREHAFTPDLFSPPAREKSSELMAAIDNINRKVGDQAVTFGKQTTHRHYMVNSVYESPGYTTKWEDIIEAW